MKKLIAMLFTVMIVGCSTVPKQTNTKKSSVQKPSGFTSTEPTSNDYPDFSKVFTRQLTQDRTLKITSVSRPWLYENYLAVSFKDEIQQDNGRWVMFDCDEIAERIIDRNLVNEITPYCAEGHKLASDYWKQHNYVPDEFVDSMGNHWKKFSENKK